MLRLKSKRRSNSNVDQDAGVIRHGLETRQRTISELRVYAKIADDLNTKSGSDTMASSGVGIAGGLMTVGAGVATFLTAGAAAPLVPLALGVGGTATSVAGAGLSIWNIVDNTKVEANMKNRIKEVLAEDDDAVKKLQDVLTRLSVEDKVYKDRVERTLRETQIFALLFNCGSSIFGSAKSWDCLVKALPVAAVYVTGATGKTVGILTQFLPKVLANFGESVAGASVEVVDDIVKETVSSITDGVTKDFVRKSTTLAAREAYKEAMKAASKEMSEELAEKTLREAAKKTAKEVAKKAAREAYKEAMKVASKEMSEELAENALKEASKKIAKEASKKAFKEAFKPALKEASKEITEEAVAKVAQETAKKAATEAAKKAAQEAAEESSKQALKTAAKITGGVTAGLGAVSVLWDGYNFYTGYQKMNESSSDLGRELRNLADFFERKLKRPNQG